MARIINIAKVGKATIVRFSSSSNPTVYTFVKCYNKRIDVSVVPGANALTLHCADLSGNDLSIPFAEIADKLAAANADAYLVAIATANYFNPS